MKKLVFSSLALGTLAIAGATVSCPIAARAAEPMRLAEAEMDGITAGAELDQATGTSVTGSTSAIGGSTSAIGIATQNQHFSALPGGGAEITGVGVALGIASGSQTSGSVIASAHASGDIPLAGSVEGVVTVSPSLASDLGKTVAYAVTWGAAIDMPQVLNK